ncbi:MAG: D-alanine--D-alanine ligase family protein [Patescibacteria group bacterium]
MTIRGTPYVTKPTAKRKLRVAILKGGPSHEHEVSLRSAENVARHLDRSRYEPHQILISKNGEWAVVPEALRHGTDVAFIAMHGAYGEDGAVQRELETAGIPYTGSRPAPSALAMNKFVSGRLLHDAGLTVPYSLLIPKFIWNAETDRILDQLRYYFHFPVVVKPNADGSSVGVSIVRDRDELIRAILDVLSFSREALVQTFIEGRELTCGVLDYGFPESAFALLPTEIIPHVSPFFDYCAKYETGGSDELTPPPNLSGAYVKLTQAAAQKAHRLVGARGFSRTDMILTPQGELFVLEINTIPGLTEQSLVPKAAAASGIPFPNLLDLLLEGAFR